MKASTGSSCESGGIVGSDWSCDFVALSPAFDHGAKRASGRGSAQAALPALLLAAHRAFIISDILFRAAALMPRRIRVPDLEDDFDLPFTAAQRAFWACEMRLRAAALIRRGPRLPSEDVTGCDAFSLPTAFKAAIAVLSRSRSASSCTSMPATFIVSP